MNDQNPNDEKSAVKLVRWGNAFERVSRLVASWEETPRRERLYNRMVGFVLFGVWLEAEHRTSTCLRLASARQDVEH